MLEHLLIQWTFTGDTCTGIHITLLYCSLLRNWLMGLCTLLTRSIRDSETSIDFVQGPPGSRRERVKCSTPGKILFFFLTHKSLYLSNWMQKDPFCIQNRTKTWPSMMYNMHFWATKPFRGGVGIHGKLDTFVMHDFPTKARSWNAQQASNTWISFEGM